MQDRGPAGINRETGEILSQQVAGTAGSTGAARPAGPLAEAVPRLDKRTYLNDQQGHLKVSLIEYGGGLAEIGWAFVPGLVNRAKVGPGLSDNRERNEMRAIRRARSNLRRKVLSAGLDHLLTLTYRANVTDYGEASAHLTHFVRLLKTHLPEFQYVAVAERQKRGAWHWHMAVKGRQNVELLRSVWRQVVGEGNIDVQQPKRGGDRRLALVKYLAKYLAKTFELGDRELGGHRYRCSIGIQVNREAIPVPLEERPRVADYAQAQLAQRSGKVGHVWKSDERDAGWACSWD